MKVICIDASVGKVFGEIPKFKEGDVLNASQSLVYSDSYNISEHLFNKEGRLHSWKKRRFIPLSNIDELELINSKKEFA